MRCTLSPARRPRRADLPAQNPERIRGRAGCFAPGPTAGAQARLLFPAYSEVLEPVTPAHIFQRRIHGAGYGYRECFESGVLQPHQYDRALQDLIARHDFIDAARIAARRLAAPFGLSDGARDAYLDCLRAHGGELTRACAAAGEAPRSPFCVSLGVLTAADVSAACDTARAHEQTAALSVLLAAAGQQQPARPREIL